MNPLRNHVRHTALTQQYPTLTEGEARFALWVEDHLPDIYGLWDWHGRQYNAEAVEQYLSVASNGEAIMCRFAVAVWTHDNRFEFDVFKAVKDLDARNLKVIQDWINKPWLA